MPVTHVALLRGVNVGGKNQLPMKVLTEMFCAAGCAGVRTYIQSGNVIFNTPAALAAKHASRITEQIAARFGFETPILLRTAGQLEKIIRSNPFLKAGAAEDHLHVMFLDGVPAARAMANLDPERLPGDKFQVIGQEAYLWLPNGSARTKLSNQYFDSKLGTTSTGRNWRTVKKLFELMSA